MIAGCARPAASDRSGTVTPHPSGRSTGGYGRLGASSEPVAIICLKCRARAEFQTNPRSTSVTAHNFAKGGTKLVLLSKRVCIQPKNGSCLRLAQGKHPTALIFQLPRNSPIW